MADPAQVADLIGEIYEAALDPALWPRVLKRVRALLDGASPMFAAAALDSDRFYPSIDVDPLFSELCAKQYLRMSSLPAFERSVPAANVFSASDATGEELRAAPLCDEPRAREVMQLLAPHFRRAAAIGRALERTESKARALSEVLDRLRSAVVFIDRSGRLVHANEPATRALALSDGLVWIDGKPRPQDSRAAAHLESILAAARVGRPAPEAGALSVAVTAVSGECLTVHVLPLSAGTRRRTSGASAAVAAVLVSRGASDIPQRMQSAANLYAFTPAESRVAQALLGGGTVGALARTLGISEATVKTHLQHIFDKTGTRRRADLVQLIAGFGTP
ncbi:MAG TPA: helix-turn-helix transcriptional regulator [Steroidobacteraceae bacterium]|nr:helix-turn-helix transcriptional regulator [Steroidobacteraceae bacterium]